MLWKNFEIKSHQWRAHYLHLPRNGWRLRCKCFSILSAITIQKQTLANSSNICVWLITNIFMLFLGLFSCWIYWEIINLCTYWKIFFIIPKFSQIFCWAYSLFTIFRDDCMWYNIFQKNLKIVILMLKQQIYVLVCLYISSEHL